MVNVPWCHKCDEPDGLCKCAWPEPKHNDWADEIAESIIDNDGAWFLDQLSPAALQGLIAAALRKAKRDGLEEAAKYFDNREAFISPDMVAAIIRKLKDKP